MQLSTRISGETPFRTYVRPDRDKALAHGDLALLRRMHCGDSLRWCSASVSLSGSSDGAGTGRVRGPRDEQGPLPVD